MKIRTKLAHLAVVISVGIMVLSCGQEDESRTFYGTGELHTQAPLKNNMVDGLAVTYFKNGKKKSEAHYKAGVLDGVAIAYFESGNIKSRAAYKKGALDGESASWDEAGKVLDQVEFKNGRLFDVPRRKGTECFHQNAGY